MRSAAHEQGYCHCTHGPPPQKIPVIGAIFVQMGQYALQVVFLIKSVGDVLALAAATAWKVKRAHIVALLKKGSSNGEGLKLVRAQPMAVHNAVIMALSFQQQCLQLLLALVGNSCRAAADVGVSHQVLL